MDMEYLDKPTFYFLHSNFFPTPQHFCFPTSFTFCISPMCWAPLAPLSVYRCRTIYCILSSLSWAASLMETQFFLMLASQLGVRLHEFPLIQTRILTRYYANLMHVVRAIPSSAVRTALPHPANTVSPQTDTLSGAYSFYSSSSIMLPELRVKKA